MQRVFKYLMIVLLIGIFYQLKDLNSSIKSEGYFIKDYLSEIRRNKKCVN